MTSARARLNRGSVAWVAAPTDATAFLHTGRWTMRMSHPVQSTAGLMPLTPFVVLGAGRGAVALSWLAGLAGQMCIWITGCPAGPAFSSHFVRNVVTGRWYGTNHPLVAATVAPVERPAW